MRAALDLILEIGVDVIAARALEVANALAGGLESLGWNVASPRPLRSPIVAATPPDVEKSLLWWHRRLEEERVICAPREGLLRFSPHYYNDATEAARIVDVLRQIAR